MQLKRELNSRMPHPDVLDKSRKTHRSLVALVVQYPLAWLVSAGASCFGASPLPLLPEADSSARVASLIGHVAIANPQVTQLRSSPVATILFMGPHGYISPELVSKLVCKMERGRRKPWSIGQMGPRYAPLLKRIVGFRTHVRAVHGRFKLGQDESPRTLSDILSGLKDASLTRWVKDFDGPLFHAPKEPT